MTEFSQINVRYQITDQRILENTKQDKCQKHSRHIIFKLEKIKGKEKNF